MDAVEDWTWTPDRVAEATVRLAALDPTLGTVIDAVGPCTLTLEPNPFPLLVRIIISQQISMKAARSIGERLRKALPAKRYTPAGIDRMSIDDLRACGLTRARATYLKELAAAAQRKVLAKRWIATATEAEISARLTALHGIGRWSVEMLLIFGLGRPDIFPDGDLGIRKAIGELYGDGKVVSPLECRMMAARWRPYRTIATWYLWRHADRKDDVTQGLQGYPV